MAGGSGGQPIDASVNAMAIFRPFSPERQRQGLVLLLAALLGLVVAGWWSTPDAQTWEAVDQEVTQLQTRLQSAAGRALSPESSAQDLLLDVPGQHETDALWPWLQQRLRAQGLQTQALQPQAMATVQGLPEQAVRLRLRGRWRDWLAFEQAMDAHVPWWTVEHWQVVPDGAKPGEVRIELQARLGLLPPALQAGRRAIGAWPAWSVVPMAPGAPLFDRPSARPVAHAVQAVPDEHRVWSADPRSWPVRALRLLGVWQQAGSAHAVLGLGQEQVTVKPGQQVGIEGYRVRRVQADAVELQAPHALGPVLHLSLQGDQP